jgi:hypothetical protein
MWSGCLGDIEWGMCEVRDPLGNALKMVKKHIKSAEKSNNQNGWRGIKQSKSHKYHFPIPLVFRIKTIKIPGNGQHYGGAAQSSRQSSVEDTPPSRRRDRTLDGRRWEEGVATPEQSEESRHTDTR